MNVTAKATRSGGWWAVEVPEVPGVFTQARRLEQVPGAVADAVAVMLEIAAESVEVTVAPTLDAPTEAAVRQAREAATSARRAQELSSVSMRAAVAALREELTTRDAAAVLGVTQQRVSQLERSARG